MRLPRESENRLARRLLMVVGLAYLAAQLLAFSIERPPSWDEAIYLSQVTPGAEPLPFVPSRARGITFLAFPILQFGGSLLQLRLFLAAASAAALVWAFRLWIPVIGIGAVAAALLFAGAWPALFYGSELMPNPWMALIGVAATAVLARRLAIHEGRSDELIAGGLVAVAALIRPLDAVVLTAALVLLPIAIRRATVSWSVHLVLGLVAGWVPWLVEMTARFGSPWEAFSAAARLGHTGRWSFFENARQYLALSDGPSIGPVAEPDVPVSGILWLIGFAALVVLGVRVSDRRGLLPSLVVPVASGMALAAEYVVLTDAQAPRFLLPALALLTVPAGLGLVAIVTGTRRGGAPVLSIAAAVAAILVISWVAVQLGIASRVEAGASRQRASAQRAGREVRVLAAGDPCQVYSEGSFPIVGFTAGCRAAPLGKVLERWKDRSDRFDGIRIFLVLHRTEAIAPPDSTALLGEVPSEGELTWFVYGGDRSSHLSSRALLAILVLRGGAVR
ncbi:MAG TPA: hypothetical protein VNP90_04960 [Actinomycetota bacterium]|nr:hypothetical protein [Actinomycetota bacterium]